MRPAPDPPPVGDAAAHGGEIGTLSYERALEELDGLITRLETGRVDLDEAISCYERGTRLAQHCERLLDRTEQKVTQVVVGGGGEREQPFEPLTGPA
ncbi:MAG: exodeoxyribonuclease VII small subunit, partial [Candidatus Dormibacteria bacterium]